MIYDKKRKPKKPYCKLILATILLMSTNCFAQTVMDDLVGLGMPAEQADYIANNVVSGGAVLGNDTYFKARNQANSANIDMLKLTANDDLLINSDSGDFIQFQIDSDANRIPLKLDASSDTALTATFGDGGTTATQILTFSASTADADDDSTLILAGGGANGGTRGASITLPGEEVSGGSDITYNAGTGDTHIFSVAGVTELTVAGTTVTLAGAGDLIFNVGLATVAFQEATAGTACSGTLTANGATPVVTATTCATTGSRIFLSRTSSETGTVNAWVSAISNGVSFSITSEAADTGTYNWVIFHESP